HSVRFMSATLMLAALLLRGRGRAPLLIREVTTLSSGFKRSNDVLNSNQKG
ncbi:MAG: Unknown protein, partial [uncultured Aureispira sp.]